MFILKLSSAVFQSQLKISDCSSSSSFNAIRCGKRMKCPRIGFLFIGIFIYLSENPHARVLWFMEFHYTRIIIFCCRHAVQSFTFRFTNEICFRPDITLSFATSICIYISTYVYIRTYVRVAWRRYFKLSLSCDFYHSESKISIRICGRLYFCPTIVTL